MRDDWKEFELISDGNNFADFILIDRNMISAIAFKKDIHDSLILIVGDNTHVVIKVPQGSSIEEIAEWVIRSGEQEEEEEEDGGWSLN